MDPPLLISREAECLLQELALSLGKPQHPPPTPPCLWRDMLALSCTGEGGDRRGAQLLIPAAWGKQQLLWRIVKQVVPQLTLLGVMPVSHGNGLLE